MTYLFNRVSYLTIYGFITLLFLFTAGCNNETNVSPASDNNVSVSYFNQNAGGDNTLVITEAKFIVRKVMFEEEDHGEEGDHDVLLGPFVVNLDMSQKIVVAALAKIPTGAFHEVKFQIHKLDPNESVSDPEFTEGTDHRFSVIVKGFFNGVPFIFKSDVTFAREIEFEESPVSVTNAAVLNITIRLDVFSWFTRDNIFLDPTNPENMSIINQNIKNSFRRAFRDMNHDGDPD